MKTIKAFCLIKRNGRMICPLTTKREDLEKTFNYQVRGEKIISVEIDSNFVCKEERKEHCKNCPFK